MSLRSTHHQQHLRFNVGIITLTCCSNACSGIGTESRSDERGEVPRTMLYPKDKTARALQAGTSEEEPTQPLTAAGTHDSRVVSKGGNKLVLRLRLAACSCGLTDHGVQQNQKTVSSPLAQPNHLTSPKERGGRVIGRTGWYVTRTEP
jgi:hypothetical protein